MKGTLRYYSGWYMQSLDEATNELHDRWLAHVFRHLFLPEVPVVFTRNRQGSFEGFAIIDKIFTAKVNRTLRGLDNFFIL